MTGLGVSSGCSQKWVELYHCKPAFSVYVQRGSKPRSLQVIGGTKMQFQPHATLNAVSVLPNAVSLRAVAACCRQQAAQEF